MKHYFQQRTISPIGSATVALLGLCVVTTLATAAEPTPDQLDFFEQKVRPILANHCYNCHSADTKPAGDLRVDDLNGLLTGGNTGPAIVPGDPEKSLLIKRIIHTDVKRRMPKESEPLEETQVAILTQWIKDGAVWPPERIPAALTRVQVDYPELKSNHWAWQPLKRPAIPAVKNQAWPLADLDRFILAKLEATNLAPVAVADRGTLLRRVTYDLTGLPPTPEEIAAFAADRQPDALERLVDRLLASPQFAERWGRHWLDVARYGESTGPSRNIPYPHAWKYRDYVLDAVQRDVPFDRFIEEQVAGDLLPATTVQERDRLQTATGFLALGVKDVNQRFKVRFIMDNVDEKIDTVSRSVLGLTISCARCHNHKFDPIPTTDYYALAGIFTSTDDCAGVRNKMGGGGLDYYDPAMLVPLDTNGIPPVPADKAEKLKGEVAQAKKEWDAIRGTPEGLALAANGRPKQRPFRLKYERLQAEFLGMTDPITRGYAVHGVRDSQTIADTQVRIRGEAERLGPVVPRGFLSTFEVPGIPAIGTNSSGRLELAEWLTSTNNPLTPRVIVNRVWSHLFGVGLVSTVDNFGVNGDRPSHPELLDYLATQFIHDGWSLKTLVRKIVLSRSYQLGSDAPETHHQLDPANRLVWRHSPRRLDAEEIRDTLLATSGRLQPAATPSAAKDLRMIEMRDNGAEAKTIHEAGDNSRQRSVYLPLLRGVTPKALEAFDPVSQTLVTGQRENTTVPTQALFLLNSTFVRQQSLALAEKLLIKETQPDAERIRHAYLLTLGRVPQQAEIERAEAFLAQYASAYRDTQHDAPIVLAAHTADPRPEKSKTDADPLEPVNPDDIDRTEEVVTEEVIQPGSPNTAAWMSFAQSLYASAEFRFVR